MKRSGQMILLWIVAGLPALLLLLLYGAMPEQMPMHFGLNGAISYGGKEALWITALLPLLLAALLQWLPRLDPKRKNDARFQRYYDSFSLILLLFFLCMNLIVWTAGLWPGQVSVGSLITLLVGALFVFLGNLLPKVKPNSFLGIRTPWTRADPDVWNKTHRIGGVLFFAAGVVIMAVSFLLPDVPRLAVLILLIVVIVLVPLVGSYVWYRRQT